MKLLLTTTMSDSAMPVGRDTYDSRWLMMNSAFDTIASVSASWSAISTAPTLLRLSADRMGMTSMGRSSVRLQLPGRLHLGGAPGRVETGAEGGDDGERDRAADHRQVERGE